MLIHPVNGRMRRKRFIHPTPDQDLSEFMQSFTSAASFIRGARPRRAEPP